MQEFLRALRYVSGTVEYDIQDALKDADDEDDFVNRVDAVMHALIEEAHWWIVWVRLVRQGFPLPF